MTNDISALQKQFLSEYATPSLTVFLKYYQHFQRFGMTATDFLYPHGLWEQWAHNATVFNICCDTFVRKSPSRQVLVHSLTVEQKIRIFTTLVDMCDQLVGFQPNPTTSECTGILEGLAPLIESLPSVQQKNCLQRIQQRHILGPELQKVSLYNEKQHLPTRLKRL